MAQLRINTALQEDYDVDIPFQLPPPTIITQFGAIYPVLTVGKDNSGRANIVWDTGSSDALNYYMYNIYWDVGSNTWVQEDMHFPSLPVTTPSQLNSRIAIAQNPLTGRNSFARVVLDQSGTTMYLCYLDGDTRYPQWLTTTISDFGQSNICCLDLVFDVNGTPNIYYVVGQTGGKWTPGSDPVAVPELSHADVGWTNTVRYGSYQDPSVNSNLTPVNGFYLSSSPGIHGPGDNTPIRSSIGANTWTYATQAVQNQWFQVDVFFLDDHSTAPLLFGALDQTSSPGVRVGFITNNSYGSPGRTDNVISVFQDVPSNRIPVWVSGVAFNTADVSTGPCEIHAVAAFTNPTDGSMEIWHTGSVPGGVIEVSDGIYSVPLGNWLPSTLITTDVLSNKQYNFSGNLAVTQPLTLTAIDNGFTLTFLNTQRKIVTGARSSETGVWSLETIESVPTPTPAQPTVTPSSHASTGLRHRTIQGPADSKLLQGSGLNTTQVYYIDITAVQPDGTPIGGMVAQLGSDSFMNMQINGESAWIDASTVRDIQFGSDGKVGITVPANGLLVPPTFWVRMEDMDVDTVIDIQPSANQLHETLQSLGSDAQNDLANIDKTRGVPLVPTTLPHRDQNCTAAQQALAAMSALITENPETTPALSDQEQRVYKSTSRHVARVGRKGASTGRLGHLKPPKTPTIFCIGFQDGLSFEHWTPEQLASFKAEIAAYDSSFFDSIGDFFEDVSFGIYNAVGCVVAAVDEAVNATVTFIVEGVTKVCDFVLEVASQVAELASVVFDAVSVAFNDLFEWLGWFFDWNDICKTQTNFSNIWDNSSGPVETQLNGLINYAIQNMSTYEGQIDTIFSTAETNLGTKATMDQIDPPPTTTSLRGASSDDSLDLQGIVDALPAGASWLLQKVQGLFEISTLPVESAGGLENFEAEVEQIFSSFTSEETSSDATQARQDLQTFFESLTSRGIFDNTTFQAMLSSLRSVAHLAVDLLKDILNVMSKLVTFIISSMFAAFSTQITSPVILGIYNLITGQTSCTPRDLCSLIIAVPYTLLYKAITGTSPNDTAAKTAQTSTSSVGQMHMVLGVATVLETFFATVQEVTELPVSEETKGRFGVFGLMEKIRAFLGIVVAGEGVPPIAPPAGTLVQKKALSKKLKLNGTSNSSSVAPDTIDIVLSVGDYASIFTSALRIAAIVRFPGSKWPQQVGYAVKFVLGAIGLSLAAYSIANDNLEGPDLLLGIGAIVGGVRDITYVSDLAFSLTPTETKPPLVWAAGVVITRCAAGLAQATLYIIAAKEELDSASASSSGRHQLRIDNHWQQHAKSGRKSLVNGAVTNGGEIANHTVNVDR